MPLLLKFTLLSTFLIVTSVSNSEEKDMERDSVAVTDRNRKEYVGAFDDREIDADDLQRDGHAKLYGNETFAIDGSAGVTRPRYRSRRMTKPEDDEDRSVSEYYKRRRPGYDDDDDEGGSSQDENKRMGRLDYVYEDRNIQDRKERKKTGSDEDIRRRNDNRRRRNGKKEDGSRKDDSERRRHYDDEDRSIPDENESIGEPDNEDEGRRRPNSNGRRKNRKNSGGNCQACGDMLGVERRNSGNYERVINGRVVLPMYKYPWIVSLSNPTVGIFCGGAIISATYILTAGHCLVNSEKLDSPQCNRKGVLPKNCYYSPNDITLRLLGRRQDDKQRPVRIAQLIPHDQFDNGRVIHDIALIRLAAPIQCNQLSSPICLPSTNLQKLGGKLIIAGWGFNTGRGRKGPKLLREGAVKQVQAQVCQRLTKDFLNNPNDIVCGMGPESRQSSCMGDSGSSIFSRFGNKFYTIGVTSRHSTSNCQANKPVTYSKVFRYMSWIKRYVKDLPGSKG